MDISITLDNSNGSLFWLTPDMSMTLLTALIGLLGALAGSIVAAIQTNKYLSKNRALLFFREFNSKEMSEHRDKAYEFVSENPFHKLHGHHVDVKNKPEIISLWIIARFFQSLYINIKTNNIDIEIAEYHFGFLFVWWWRNYFENAMKDEWTIKEDLNDLNKILETKYPSKYIKWRASAFDDFMKFKAIRISQ